MGNEESKIKNSTNKVPKLAVLTEDDVLPLDLTEDSEFTEDDDEYSEDFEDTSMYNIAGYEFVRKLGSGASGVVIQMKKDGVDYAVKVCNCKKAHLNFLNPSSHDPKEEAVIMKRLNNPNVVKVYDFIEDIDNNLIYIVMELMAGGSIENCTSIEQKRKAFGQVLTALQYLHNQRLAHRDIKVENVMLSGEGDAKLCDFGISVYVPTDAELIDTEMKGTPAYCAPELFCTEKYDPFKADIWAFGVTLYILSFHDLPFKAANVYKMQQAIAEDEVTFPDGADPQLADLISQMLIKDPSKRITIDGIWSHPWANGLRPPFAGMFLAFSQVCIQVSEMNTKDIITRVKRGAVEMVKKKKERRSKLHKILHGSISNLKERRRRRRSSRKDGKKV
ncbi:Serine/threonine-protein kinase GRIK2 [Tritrichomonas foetus]|uniref:Serine/threonine-protein kinase GRIK2 n=1 Tax=Tritrichomonas foetus TaxID=1144522 RepID=A0A1J4KMT0_9EUKA|nr:Serine/threonine-protein kinase GRIK2 [Tritrichomonas foetus]|eukprot:OHT11108.1 Serine/threonine-protein kinase GRIK2 [Tritrichomonas foetus]